MHVSQQYHQQYFVALPRFQAAKRSLESARVHLEELGSVICRYDLQDHIGISLLHKHFYISPDEQLVKEFVGEEAYIRPRELQKDEHVVPYLWKVERESATYHPLEFIDTTNRAVRGRKDALMLANAEDFLAEMVDTLCGLGLEDVFGVSTLHGVGEIPLSDDEMLLETTDHEQRVLTLAVTSRVGVDLSDITETTWQFTAITEAEDLARCKADNHCSHRNRRDSDRGRRDTDRDHKSDDDYESDNDYRSENHCMDTSYCRGRTHCKSDHHCSGHCIGHCHNHR
jgi:hypothetical protein